MEDIKVLFNEWQALQPLRVEDQKRLNDKFMLEFNYNSNHIEGNTLTYGQTMLLLIQGKVDGNAPMRDFEEMKAHHAALEFVKQTVKEDERPLTEAFIRQVHKIMLKEDYVVYENRGGQQIQYTIHAGIYKTRPNSVKTQTGEIFDYASPEETPALMTDLVTWYNAAETEGKMSPLEMAALFHYRYIRIHPFEDGNGRIARLMVNYILSLHGYPMIVVREEDKNNYINVLEKCDSVVGLIPAVGAHAELKQITPLVEYMETCLERALRISIKAAKGENIEEEDDLQKRLVILARNAQAKHGNVNRIGRKYLLEIYDNFIIPFNKKIGDSLSIYNQFYGDTNVDYYHIHKQTKQLLIALKYNLENDSVSKLKDVVYVIKISLESPSGLIPADSKENINIYIKYDDEKYEISLFDKTETFKYGVLPTDSEQNEWMKKIAEYLYASIEKKVNSQE